MKKIVLLCFLFVQATDLLYAMATRGGALSESEPGFEMVSGGLSESEFKDVMQESVIGTSAQYAGVDPKNLKEAPLAGWSEIQNLAATYHESIYNPINQTGIRKAYYYLPTSAITEPTLGEAYMNPKPILLVVVHGTGFAAPGFATGGKVTKDFFDINSVGFRGILDFARNYAHEKQAPVEVVSYQWTGGNSVVERRKAALGLGQFLASRRGYDLITVSHSHGGNVVNAASYITPDPINMMIQIATPVRENNLDADEQEYKPVNFSSLIQFWSSNDWVVPLGSMSTWGDFWSKKGSIRKFGYVKPIFSVQPGVKLENKIYNIRVQVDGVLVDHSPIASITPHLNSIVNDLENRYLLHTDLDLNIAKDQAMQACQGKSYILAIRHPLAETDYYKEFIIPEMQNPQNAQMVKQAEPVAVKYSDQQKALYKKCYNKDMTANDPYWKQIVTGISAYLPALRK